MSKVRTFKIRWKRISGGGLEQKPCPCPYRKTFSMGDESCARCSGCRGIKVESRWGLGPVETEVKCAEGYEHYYVHDA